MAKRVAITIAGAVSLGSYEAGVTYELLEALRVHNESTETEDDKIFVDVITGASAGGMTAAMLGEWLMFFGKSMEHPTENPLYRAWVSGISLAGLVKLGRGENRWGSLLSSDVVASIGTKMLVEPMAGRPSVQQHACLEPGMPLRIGLALTNLQGVNYTLRIEGNSDEGFNYTRSADQRIFTIYPGGDRPLAIVDGAGQNHPAAWLDLCHAAVACGAFPFAFRPCDVARKEGEYVTEATPLWKNASDAKVGTTYVQPLRNPCTYTYTDGGVLQNQPLGIAKDLVEASVGTRLSRGGAAKAAVRSAHQDGDDRLYAFISPNEVRSTAEEEFGAKTINLMQIGPQVLKTYVRQATFHDWIMAEKVNQDVRVLDVRAGQLADLLAPGAGEDRIQNVDEFLEVSTNLNDLLLGVAKGEALIRLEHQYEALINKLGGDRKRIDAFVNGVATLEAAAELGDKDKMHIVAVLADGRKELAGSGICAFVGFFSRKFREHDYMVGRRKAQTYLRRRDVQKILKLNVNAVTGEWARKENLGKPYRLEDPETIVKLPLSVPRMLAPAVGPLAWMIALRAWPLLLGGAVLMVAFGRHRKLA